ncbi:hypothetical protein JCGZ_18690 [Jatropha curcas]|uniref:BHLH domain-containing protein n=1 Tax=Jatropha curcas TaxID=180498 RepID=A0A067KBZ3_JATCU|nr:transcription factor bHLH131 [Jatropha curcas]KDP29755.1 hypothetical protein JCGZ_18690 [Jatropha curcas]
MNLHSSESFMDALNYRSSLSMSKGEAKVVSALKHKEAERKRRVRINNQYAKLRSFLPNLIKRNKASVLAETIQRVKELENTVSELKEIYGFGLFPGGKETLSVEYSKRQGQRLVKVMFSCDDKEKLMSDIERAVMSGKGKVVRVEIVAVCGWTKSVLWVQGINGNRQLDVLRTALDAIIDPIMPNSKPATCRD